MARTLCRALLACPKETSDWGTRESHLEKDIFKLREEGQCNNNIERAKEEESIINQRKKNQYSWLYPKQQRPCQLKTEGWEGYWWPLPEHKFDTAWLFTISPTVLVDDSYVIFPHQREKLLDNKRCFTQGHFEIKTSDREAPTLMPSISHKTPKEIWELKDVH